MQRHRCGRPRGSVARAVALHCKSAAPGAATVRKEPHIRTLPGDRPLSFRRAGRSRTRAGRPRASAPSGWNDGLSPAWCATSRLAKGSALSTTHRSLAAACSAARRRAAMAGSCCPSTTATEARRCPTTRARPFRGRMDDCSYSLSRMRRSGTARCRRPLPGPRTCYRTRRAQKNATRTGARARQHDEPPYTHGARAKRGPRASHTHYEHTTSATRRPAREKHTHPIQKYDRVPSEYAEPGLRRGRRHNLQIDGTARPSYGGRWLLRRAFSRSTRWLMWSWTTCFV